MTSATFRTAGTGVPRFDDGPLATVYGASAPTFQVGFPPPDTGGGLLSLSPPSRSPLPLGER